MNDLNDLGAFYDLAWKQLENAMKTRNLASRQVALATVSKDGKPEVRTVVLRDVSRATSILRVNTDVVSAKVASLDAHPYAELLYWNAETVLQLRLKARVEIMRGDETASIWPSIPKESRGNYGSNPETGTPIANVFDYEKLGLAQNFAILTFHVDDIDVVELGDRHRRAHFSRKSDWAGQWFVP
ncbi:MAG: pyridoxamine 5'-phosphate oxidase family protein [Paracoccaceae bacterium]